MALIKTTSSVTDIPEVSSALKNDTTVGGIRAYVDSLALGSGSGTPGTTTGLTQAQADGLYVNIGGDTMSGALLLNTNVPINSNAHATTKQYVDSAIVSAMATTLTQSSADSRYLRLSGGSISGPLSVSGASTLSGTVTLGSNPTTSMHAATKQYVDNEVANVSTNFQSDGDARYLRLSGGSMTGPLTLNPSQQTLTNHAATIGYVSTAIINAGTGGSVTVPAASTTVAGKVELATTAEVQAGTDDIRAVTPVGVAAAMSAAISTHSSASDPHPGYTTAAELAAAISTHSSASDPHPGYTTAAELATAISSVSGGSGVGIGQTWQRFEVLTYLNPTRVVNTSYQNTTGKPIQVIVDIRAAVEGMHFQVSANNSTWVTLATVDDITPVDTISPIIPTNHYYRAYTNPYGGLGIIDKWLELR